MWIMILVNSVGSTTSHEHPSVNTNLWIINEYSYFVRGRQNIFDIIQGHGTDLDGQGMLWIKTTKFKAISFKSNFCCPLVSLSKTTQSAMSCGSRREDSCVWTQS